MLGTARGSTRSHCVENWLWKGLWTCRWHCRMNVDTEWQRCVCLSVCLSHLLLYLWGNKRRKGVGSAVRTDKAVRQCTLGNDKCRPPCQTAVTRVEVRRRSFFSSIVHGDDRLASSLGRFILGNYWI